MAFPENIFVPIGVVSAAMIAGAIAYVGLITTKESKVSEFRQKWINDLRDEIVTFAACVDTLMEHISKESRGRIMPRPEIMLLKLNHPDLYNKMERSRLSIILRINELEEDRRQRITNRLFVRKVNRIATAFEKGNFQSTRFLIKELVPIAKNILKHEWMRTRDGEKWYQYGKSLAEWTIGAAATVIMAILMAITFESLSTVLDSAAAATQPEHILPTSKPSAHLRR